MLLTPERAEQTRARLLAAVEEALAARAVSARRASLEVVGNDGLIRDLRAGRLPGVDRLEALFEFLGLEFYLGPRRAQTGTGFADPSSEPRPFEPREALRAGFLPIPWHPEAPRPPGLPTAPIAFAKAWLEAEGLDPARLAAVMAAAPAPLGGEVVALVDPGAARREGPALWCYRETGRAALGQLQFEPEVTLILAAPEAPAQVLKGEERARLALFGRVVWWGRREAGPGGRASE